MKYEKKVSICMMVKNEEKNLHRCLNSLQPLIKSGLAELIIIDTGSEDQTLEIAKEYTEKVYQHPWNNNFSEMRNISISYAKGEWIWIIDADEEIENPEEMVSLFSGDLSEYNTINITIKNYMNTPVEGEEGFYNISILKRGFRNREDFEFVGAVHNQPLAKEPSLMSKVIFGHYGYIWEDKEFTKKKFERTAGILQKELEKNPESVYYQFQLAVSWANIDKKRSLEEMRKAYELIKKFPKKNRINYLYVYGIYARIADINKKYLDAIEICKEGLAYSRDYIDLWFVGGNSYRAINDVENASEYFQEFMDLTERFQSTKISQNPAFTFYHADDLSKDRALYYLGLIEFQKEKYDKALEYAEKLNPSDMKSDIILKISMKTSNYDVLVEYLKEISDDEKLRKALIYNLEKHNIKDTNNIALYQKIIDFYDIQNSNYDPYYFLNLVRVNLAEETSIEEAYLEELLNLSYKELPNYYGDIIFYLIKENIDLSLFENFGYEEHINSFLKYAMGKYEDFYAIIQSYLEQNSPQEVNKLRYWILLARYVLLSEKFDTVEYMDLFNKYVDRGISYLHSIYNPTVINEDMLYDLKNDEHRFFLYLAKANENKEIDTKKYVNFLRKALDVYPMKKGIEELLERVKEDAFKVEDEMSLLKMQFKNNIKMLIENKKLLEAEELIKQYEQIVLEDVEILLFKSQIDLLKVQEMEYILN